MTEDPGKGFECSATSGVSPRFPGQDTRPLARVLGIGKAITSVTLPSLNGTVLRGPASIGKNERSGRSRSPG